MKSPFYTITYPVINGQWQTNISLKYFAERLIQPSGFDVFPRNTPIIMGLNSFSRKPGKECTDGAFYVITPGTVPTFTPFYLIDRGEKSAAEDLYNFLVSMYNMEDDPKMILSQLDERYWLISKSLNPINLSGGFYGPQRDKLFG